MAESWGVLPMGCFIATLTCQFLQSAYLAWETKVSYKSCLNAIFVFKA